MNNEDYNTNNFNKLNFNQNYHGNLTNNNLNSGNNNNPIDKNLNPNYEEINAILSNHVNIPNQERFNNGIDNTAN